MDVPGKSPWEIAWWKIERETQQKTAAGAAVSQLL
jgi:hypothetical protein